MPGGGGDSTVTQTNIPEYAEPYVLDLFDRAETESTRAYEPYGGKRLAGVADDTRSGRRYLRNDIDPGLSTAGQAYGMFDSAGNMVNSSVGGGPFGIQEYNFQGPGSYLGNSVSQYMSPYMQNVVDVEKARAELDFDRAQAGRDAAAVQAGAFGGSRGAVVDALAQEELSRRLGEIQAQGQQRAFDTGAGLFEADRAARLGVDQSRAAEAARVDDIMNQYGFAYDQLGLEGAGILGALGQQYADVGAMDQDSQYRHAEALMGIGDDIQAREQQRLDLNYQDFLTQQNFPADQLEWYSDLIRGNIRGNDTQSQLFQQANPFKDILGAGITGLSLQQLFGSA